MMIYWWIWRVNHHILIKLHHRLDIDGDGDKLDMMKRKTSWRQHYWDQTQTGIDDGIATYQSQPNSHYSTHLWLLAIIFKDFDLVLMEVGDKIYATVNHVYKLAIISDFWVHNLWTHPVDDRYSTVWIMSLPICSKCVIIIYCHMVNKHEIIKCCSKIWDCNVLQQCFMSQAIKIGSCFVSKWWEL